VKYSILDLWNNDSFQLINYFGVSLLELQLSWARSRQPCLIDSIGITAFVRTESNASVKLPTSERQSTAVVIRPYGIHRTVYIGDLCPTENIIKQSILFYAVHTITHIPMISSLLTFN
jgi:hypothetical protein